MGKQGNSNREKIKKSPTDYCQLTDSGALVHGRKRIDSILFRQNKLSILEFRLAAMVRQQKYEAKVGGYAKGLIFLIILFIALLFYLLFYKSLKYYGSALTFSTHFIVYNLCIYCIHLIINILPGFIWGREASAILLKPFFYIFYNPSISPATEFFLGSQFEFLHFILWAPWLFIAFKRLFTLPWWKNLLLTYLSVRVIYFLVFGVLKKIIIGVTIWSL